jgi:serine protease
MQLRTSRSMCRGLTLAIAAALCSMLSLPAFSAARVEVGGLKSGETVDSLIIAYKPGSALRSNKAMLQRKIDDVAAAAFGRARGIGLRYERTLGIGAEVLRISKPLDRIDAERLMRQLALDPAVQYVEPNLRLYPTLTPNDPSYSQQYGFQSVAGGSNANQAWDLGFRGAGKIVAVIDSGVTFHPDLSANVITGYDFISDPMMGNDGDGRDNNPIDPGDWNTAGQCPAWPEARNSTWHGTHVAGTVAALTNNGVGVSGMAFNAKVLNVRALGRCGGTIADIADAVTWSSGGAVAGVPAVGANRATVINMSLGGIAPCSPAMQTAIDGAVSRNTSIVVAAGNDGINASNFLPANCNNVIVVGATNSTGAKAFFSNYGSIVDVSAPGVGILSTYNTGTTTQGAASYQLNSGTSMAAPHVAGLIAMMHSKPSADCTPAQCEALLRNNVKPFGIAPPVGQLMGTGVINALKTLNATP